jgi:hypothetical protein
MLARKIRAGHSLKLLSVKYLVGHAVGLGTAQQIGKSRVRFPMASLEFFIDKILPAALSQEYFLRRADKLTIGLS